MECVRAEECVWGRWLDRLKKGRACVRHRKREVLSVRQESTQSAVCERGGLHRDSECVNITEMGTLECLTTCVCVCVKEKYQSKNG